jgi:hypothetical protein
VEEEEIAEQEGLLAQAPGSGMVWEEIAEFVAKDTGAGGFEKDDGQAGVDFGGETIHGAFEIGTGFREKSEIVERAAAAEVASGDLSMKSGVREDIMGSGEGLRAEVVVPGVGPEENCGPVL